MEIAVAHRFKIWDFVHMQLSTLDKGTGACQFSKKLHYLSEKD